jgi:hypothetical protein
LKALDLEASTDIFVTSDHGFSTISKESDTSHSLRCQLHDVPPGHLPPGFLALDIAYALDIRLWDPDIENAAIDAKYNCGESGPPKELAPLLPSQAKHPKNGSGLIGPDPDHPHIVVTAGAGSALIYLTSDFSRSVLAKPLVTFLLRQDYVGGLFVDPSLGVLPGTIPLDQIGLTGAARTPHPSIVVSFRSFSTGCDEPLRCGAEVADSFYGQGQGMHGAFSRADTFNFMAAIGPDFRQHFVDPAPVGNADIAPTLAHILGFERADGHGDATGRVLEEALLGGRVPT